MQSKHWWLLEQVEQWAMTLEQTMHLYGTEDESVKVPLSVEQSTKQFLELLDK